MWQTINLMFKIEKSGFIHEFWLDVFVFWLSWYFCFRISSSLAYSWLIICVGFCTPMKATSCLSFEPPNSWDTLLLLSSLFFLWLRESALTVVDLLLRIFPSWLVNMDFFTSNWSSEMTVLVPECRKEDESEFWIEIFELSSLES